MVEDGNQDRVRGIVHALRLVRLMMAEGPEAKIESAVRDALIVPETKPLDDLLTELQRQRSSMGVVVDEYGRTVGIVTVEDILEEVVGEIEDETDPLAGSLRQLANGDWYVRGHVSLGDLTDRGIELPVDTDAYNSIGGYVFGELGRLPKRGDLITADGYEIRVESVRENRIEAVRIHADRRLVRRLQEFSLPSVYGSSLAAIRGSLEEASCGSSGSATSSLRWSGRCSAPKSTGGRLWRALSRPSTWLDGMSFPRPSSPGPRWRRRQASRASRRPT